MKVLVTGGGGFLGKAIVKQLLSAAIQYLVSIAAATRTLKIWVLSATKVTSANGRMLLKLYRVWML